MRLTRQEPPCGGGGTAPARGHGPTQRPAPGAQGVFRLRQCRHPKSEYCPTQWSKKELRKKSPRADCEQPHVQNPAVENSRAAAPNLGSCTLRDPLAFLLMFGYLQSYWRACWYPIPSAASRTVSGQRMLHTLSYLTSKSQVFSKMFKTRLLPYNDFGETVDRPVEKNPSKGFFFTLG